MGMLVDVEIYVVNTIKVVVFFFKKSCCIKKAPLRVLSNNIFETKSGLS